MCVFVFDIKYVQIPYNTDVVNVLIHFFSLIGTMKSLVLVDGVK